MKHQLNQWKSALVVVLTLTSMPVFGELSTNMAGVASTGKLELQMHQTANADELLLTLSGAQPKKYYILSTPGVSNIVWGLETVVDCSISRSVTLSMGDRPQAFFKAISEDDYKGAMGAGENSNIVGLAAGKPGDKSAAARIVGKEWFVDGKIGHDGFDGRSKQRNGNNGPLATIKKAVVLSQSGDFVNIASGKYAEDLDLRGKNITVKLEGTVNLHVMPTSAN